MTVSSTSLKNGVGVGMGAFTYCGVTDGSGGYNAGDCRDYFLQSLLST